MARWREEIYAALEAALSKLKGRPYALDRRIPLRLIGGMTLRRMAWVVRGVLKTTLASGRPALAFIAPCVSLRNTSMVRFGKGVTLEQGVILDGSSAEGIWLGDNVTIGAYSTVCASTFGLLGLGIRFGNHSSCGPYSFIGAAAMITIGENVIMGQHVSFHAENHNFDRVDVPIRVQGVNRRGIVIEDDCWVGANVVFLDGTHVGHGCVVAAGAVVRGDIPPYSVVAGVPARVIKSRLPELVPVATVKHG